MLPVPRSFLRTWFGKAGVDEFASGWRGFGVTDCSLASWSALMAAYLGSVELSRLAERKYVCMILCACDSIRQLPKAVHIKSC